MRSHEIITLEAYRPGSRLQPEWSGVALLGRVSACLVGDPDLLVAKVNCFGLVIRSFELAVHIFAPGLKSSSNHDAFLSAKLNQVRLDGEPHNPAGFPFAADVVNARDELTKRQGALSAIGLHGPKCKPGNRAGAMGCLPHVHVAWTHPRQDVRAAGASTGRPTGDWTTYSRNPMGTDGWLSQFDSGSFCSRGLSVARRTFCTVSSNASTAKGFISVAAS